MGSFPGESFYPPSPQLVLRYRDPTRIDIQGQEWYDPYRGVALGGFGPREGAKSWGAPQRELNGQSTEQDSLAQECIGGCVCGYWYPQKTTYAVGL